MRALSEQEIQYIEASRCIPAAGAPDYAWQIRRYAAKQNLRLQRQINAGTLLANLAIQSPLVDITILFGCTRTRFHETGTGGASNNTKKLETHQWIHVPWDQKNETYLGHYNNFIAGQVVLLDGLSKNLFAGVL
jgi:hypothetical protein